MDVFVKLQYYYVTPLKIEFLDHLRLPIPSLLAFTMIRPMTKQISSKHLEDSLGL